MQSATLPLYSKWLDTATSDEIAFVDAIYALCEKHYSSGGDTIVETFTPSEILSTFPTLDDVRSFCNIHHEATLNARWGEDSDPILSQPPFPQE